MIPAPVTPVIRDLVLAGGGHSHVAVLKSFRMQPLAGVRVTLVSRGWDTPYSGMLPGVVAGRYSRDEAHIDLVRLCRHCGVRFIQAEVCGIDPQRRELQLLGRPPLHYDLLSLNTGSVPAQVEMDGAAADAVIFTKPIDRFLQKWERLRARVARSDAPFDIAIVGGGVAGVELALSIERRLLGDGVPRARLNMTLLTAGAAILETHGAHVRRRLLQKLAQRGVEVRTDARVERVLASASEAGADDASTAEASGAPRRVRLATAGGTVQADAVVWATQASPARWLAASALATDAEGFVAVNEFLQSTSHADVFSVGDVAASVAHPRPKAGVFAVRQGRPLAENLRRHLLGRPLKRFVPQRQFLSLIGTGDEQAVASRGFWSAQGDWVWKWKDRIDRRFMHRFSVPDASSDAAGVSAAMPAPDPRVLAAAAADELASVHADGMRCAGCGSKASAEVLARALGRLRIAESPDVLRGIAARDDAAVMRVPANKVLVLSVDAFTPIVEDPYVFGAITANHCLNDLYAMHAQPAGALAHATLPAWTAEKLGDELYQLLAGALSVLEPAGAALVGGHTGEGSELSLGFTVTGTLEESRLFGKTGHRAGDRLILTKPIGTGCLFAADMRAQSRAPWIAAAVAAMCQSNAAAAECFAGHEAHAVTDVTGFGLAGHLLEMLADDPLAARLSLGAVPLLPGVLDVLARGWVSSLHAANRRWVEPQLDAAALGDEERALLTCAALFDPQTAGPLLAGVAAERADACVADLRARGYAQAAVIGEIVPRVSGSEPRVRLQSGS